MRNPRVFAIVTLLLTSTANLKAQSTGSDYTTAVGAKFYPGGLTVKHFIQEDRALEGLLYVWGEGYRITGLYEFYGNINGVEGLKWYAGGGAHIGAFNDVWKTDNPNKDHNSTFGLDAVLGLDFKFTGVPINMSLDWQPSYNLTGYNYLEGAWGGLAIRYTF